MKEKILETPWNRLVVSDDPMTSNEHEAEFRGFVASIKWPARPVFLDIGAHQGLWATFLAHLAGPLGIVYAFEPHPDNVSYLFRNCKPEEGMSPVVICPFAVGNMDGIGMLRCFNYDEKVFASTGKHQFVEGDEPDYGIHVAMRKLDSLVFPKVDFIKTDAEHHEFEVLKGAENLIAKDKPKMLIEIHDTRLGNNIRSWLTDRNYKIDVLKHYFPHDGHTLPYFFCVPKEEE